MAEHECKPGDLSQAYNDLDELLLDIVDDFENLFQGGFHMSDQADDSERTSWKLLISTMDALSISLTKRKAQGIPITKDLYKVMGFVARGLQKIVNVQPIREWLKEAPHAHLLVSKAFPNSPDFDDLEMFRIYALDVPKRNKAEIKKRSLLRYTTVARRELLSDDIDRCCQLLENIGRNPRAKSPQPRKMRYSEEAIHRMLGQACKIDELHILLRDNWPCVCPLEHAGKLGSCANILLCLQPQWAHPEGECKEFELLLRFTHCQVHCTVNFEDESTEKERAYKLNSPECQTLVDEIRESQLKIYPAQVGIQNTSIDFRVDLDSPSALKHRYTTLEDLLRRSSPLRKRERRILAVVLMYAFMRLLDGEWLQQGQQEWDERDITFMPSTLSPDYFNFRQPYLSACWMQVHPKSRRQRVLAHQKPAMVTLARFLLGLELKTTIYAWKLEQESLRSDLFWAKHYLECLREADSDSGERADFIHSMEACLQNTTYIDSPNPVWSLYQKAVSPLEQELEVMLEATGQSGRFEAELRGVSPEKSAFNPMVDTEVLPAAQIPESDKWFKKLEEQTHMMMKNSPGLGPVKIAVLDTGVDLNHPLNKVDPKNCYDFVDESHTQSKVICDDVGHGTHTASLISRIAPGATIFCARVFKERKEVKGVTGQLIVRAIEMAVIEWGIDIIVMPFTFDHRIEEIRRAILKHSSILYFAAAGNDRGLVDGFPASAHGVIGIYSNKSTTTTEKSDFCPQGKSGRKNFSAVGEAVEGSWPLSIHPNTETKREDGTSCAAAIVAGVAGLILRYARNTVHPVDRADELESREVMEKVIFKCMTAGHTSTTNNLIEPWRLFSILDTSGNKKKLPKISAEIALRIQEP